MRSLYIFVLALTVGLSACDSGSNNTSTSKTHKKERQINLISADSILQTYGEGLYAQMNITEGDVLLKLEMEKAPLTVANFVALAEGTMPNKAKDLGVPFYDGLTFHRVINVANGDGDNFMIQGGDPEGTGMGGPGYQFRNEIVPSLSHNRPGILAMANSGPNTNGSQFYITNGPRQQLDGSYNIFGKVVSGQSSVDQTLKGDKIYFVKIIRVGEAAKNFDALNVFNSLK